MHKTFPCTACGKCCQRVNNSEQTAFLDRGDGVCKHFDMETKLCSIYETRPLVCRVEDYYKAHLAHLYSWDDFVEMNIQICNRL
ncbi:YkgJ family cysteine cluster protein [Caviibacterium pharyngocola]|uniref:Zinc/iron-chelating domain-containing protein n=1 Tax=Caviibacterium pharyngocola TaxID=28159 RepID=A0A2M8RWT9_9PAST|nr:YkgJ family cysteine cluster protein [Caviibacterium pharyngocola]PJG83341.1 zinc/iron-chelating domain-containing protein [Caviibacterium pharyngocola]